MPRPKTAGRGRLEIHWDPAFLDLTAQAAKLVGSDLSSYVRRAIVEQLKRDGFELPLPTVSTAPTNSAKRPAGRRKAGNQ